MCTQMNGPMRKGYPPKQSTIEYLLKEIKDEKNPSLEWRFHCLHLYIKARLFYIPNVKVEYSNRSGNQRVDLCITIFRPKRIVGPYVSAYRIVILRDMALVDPETIIANMFKEKYVKK